MQSSAQRRAFPRYSLCCLCLVMIFTYGGMKTQPSVSVSALARLSKPRTVLMSPASKEEEGIPFFLLPSS